MNDPTTEIYSTLPTPSPNPLSLNSNGCIAPIPSDTNLPDRQWIYTDFGTDDHIDYAAY
jgi:hypothetical protein